MGRIRFGALIGVIVAMFFYSRVGAWIFTVVLIVSFLISYYLGWPILGTVLGVFLFYFFLIGSIISLVALYTPPEVRK